MVNPALSPPPKMATDVINHWNSMPNVAVVPKSRFPVERRHVIAALKSMTSQTIPNWDESFAKIHYAIKAYADIRNDSKTYEYVNDRTLSQVLKWELVRFLEVNQPYMRLRKDKTRLPEKPTKVETKEEVETRIRQELAEEYNTNDPVEIDCLRYAEMQNYREYCYDCIYTVPNELRCKHPKWPHITKDYMDNCHTPREEK